MNKQERYNLISAICKKYSAGPLRALNSEIEEEVILASKHNDDESIIEIEADSGKPFVSKELIKRIEVISEEENSEENYRLTKSEKIQLEKDIWANRRKFALMII